MRRFSWREDRTLYKNTCALCKKSTISIHAPGGPFTVYCRECWMSDKWDSMIHGRNYDFSQPFFTQYRKLMEAVPRPALTGTNLVNSEYSHACQNAKNCYYTFLAFFTEDSQYTWAPLLSRQTFDSYVTDKSEQTYETLLSDRLYRVRFSYFTHDCLESSFLFDCVGCSYCFGCVNMRKQKYRLFNKQFFKEEYLKRMKYWDIGSYSRLDEAKKKFKEFYLSVPHRYADIVNSVNVIGDVIRDSKNCHMCFSALEDVYNCKYVYFAGLCTKDSYDISVAGDLSELLYEVSYTIRAQRVRFSSGVTNSIDIDYCDWARTSSNLFGCIALKNKQYCILNKQYDRSEYGVLISKIKKHMDEVPYIDAKGRTYKYGEFFPPELSAYAYNESHAFVWYPKAKSEALEDGLQWRDPSERKYNITLEPEKLSDHIRDVDDSILQEVIGCLHRGVCNHTCATAFRLTKEELIFYRDMQIALPRLCPSCRHAERIQWRNGFHLYKRKCMCSGTKSHATGAINKYENWIQHFHGAVACPNEFETTYAPHKPEIVYCDQCYKAEFL